VEQPRDLPLELLIGLREEMAELRATVTHLSADMVEVKQDIRRLDGRIFQLMLVQLVTLATALGSLATALLA
jgi:hypothetical protein